MKPAKINYVEFPASDLSQTTTFFSEVFGWQFRFYGPEYVAFTAESAGLDGGFFQSEQCSSTQTGGALIVLFSQQLEQTAQDVIHAGGQITKPIFTFPGGRRFHFTEPSGNEMAVWSDK